MFDHRIALFAIGGVYLLFAQSAVGGQTIPKVKGPDSGGHWTRKEHVAYCELSKRTCLFNYSPLSPRNSHERLHCEITYDQCMNRWPD